MKIAKRILAAAVFGISLPAHAATTDPLKLIYVVSGVSNNAQTATAVMCTNASGVSENFQVVIKDHGGNIPPTNNTLLPPPSGATVTYVTQPVGSLTGNDFILVNANATIAQGSIAVFSTTQVAFCTAMIVAVGSNNTAPAGIALHMVRLNPMPGAAAE